MYWLCVLNGRETSLIWKKWLCHHMLCSKWSLCRFLTTVAVTETYVRLGESLHIHQILDASKLSVNQCCKTRKGCTLQSDFGSTYYLLEECFKTRGWMMRSQNMRSSHLSVAAEEHAGYRLRACMIEVYCTTLRCDSDQGSAFPFPWDKGP